MEDKIVFRGREPLALRKEALADIQREASLGTSRKSAAPRGRGQVAIIPVHGPLTYYDSWFATSMRRIGQVFDAAIADKSVSAIVLDVDSPGGTVAGTPELGEKIFSATGKKPIIAVANAEAASAGYWIASAAENFVVTPSGEVGSIGVWTMHQDISGMMGQMGVDTTIVSAGKYKVEGHPFAPLDDEAKAELQRSVNESYREFLQTVAKHRGTSQQNVERNFGQGRMMSSRKALSVGMVDGVATLESVVRDLTHDRPVKQYAYEDGITKMLSDAFHDKRNDLPLQVPSVIKEDIAAMRRAEALCRPTPDPSQNWRYVSQAKKDADELELARAAMAMEELR